MVLMQTSFNCNVHHFLLFHVLNFLLFPCTGQNTTYQKGSSITGMYTVYKDRVNMPQNASRVISEASSVFMKGNQVRAPVNT